MNGAQILAWRVRGALTTVGMQAERTSADLWLHRPHPGGNVLGFTLWHAATVVDWTVNRLIRGEDELRSDGRWRGTGLDAPFIPFGMPLADADAIAERVDPDAVVAYTAALGEQAGTWIDGLAADDLVAVPDARTHVDAGGLPQLPGFIEEAAWMFEETPTYELLGRVCISHVFFHAAEIVAARDAALATRA